PREKVPQVIGTLQSAQILVSAIAPFVGGILADTIGVRTTFFITGIVMLGGVINIFLLYEDNEERHVIRSAKESSGFWKHPAYLTTMMILFFVNMADRTFGLILPLFLEELGTPASRLAIVSGTLISVAAFGEAFSAWLSGKLATKVALRQLIGGRLVLSVF